ncbi:hypothetical protein N336_06252, partial [Phalacrocorax carbo]
RPLLQHTADSTSSYLEESIWSLGGETWFVLATQNSVRQGELDFRILHHCNFTYMELLDRGSTALAGSNFLNFHDLNRVSTGTMTGSHITVWNKS